MSKTSINPKDSPLSVNVIGQMLVISVGVETLKQCYNLAGFQIQDAKMFAKDVALRLDRQREDGSGMLTDLLEKAVLAAVEGGSPNVRFPKDPYDTSGNPETWQ